MSKAVVKFNNGNLAVLCSYCYKILKTGKDLTNDELFLIVGEDNNRLPAQYCDDCKKNPPVETEGSKNED